MTRAVSDDAFIFRERSWEFGPETFKIIYNRLEIQMSPFRPNKDGATLSILSPTSSFPVCLAILAACLHPKVSCLFRRRGIAAMALLPPMKLKTDRTLGRLVIRVSHARVIVTTNLHPSVWREAATHLEVGFAALARVPSGLGAVQVQGPRFKAALSPRAIFPTPTGSPKCLSMRRTPAAGALYCLPRRRELSCGFRCPRASCHFAFQAPL